MSFRVLASANGVLSLVTGFVMLVAPAAIAAFYQTTASARESAVLQMLGAAYVGFGLLLWMVRAAGDSGVQRAVAAGALASWAVSLAVSFIWLGLVSGPGVWGTIALQAAFSLGWLYLRLRNASRTVVA